MVPANSGMLAGLVGERRVILASILVPSLARLRERGALASMQSERDRIEEENST
jgi:hypothetical protein